MAEMFSTTRQAAEYLERVLPQYEGGATLPDPTAYKTIVAADTMIPVYRSFDLQEPDYSGLALRVSQLGQRMRQQSESALSHAHPDASHGS